MNKKIRKNTELRKKAESMLHNKFDAVEYDYKDVDEIIYELRIHQIELEMQNEELLETQLNLDDSRREYFDLYNFAPVGYFTLDRNGIILKVNLTGADLLGSDKQNLHRSAFVKFVAMEYRNKFHHHIMDVIDKDSNESIELELVKEDGNSFYSKLETLKILNENGNFKEFRVVITDITNQKEAERLLSDHNADIQRILNEEIEEHKIAEINLEEAINKYKVTNNELKQFAYVSSHDLKEPLRMITSFLQLLQRKYQDKLDQDANEYITFAVNGAKQLDQLINDLLEYSNVAKKERQNLPVNFEHVLEKALHNLKSLIDENDAIITHDHLPVINGDEKLKVQLFQNLISNAIKYRSQEAPIIHISATKETDKTKDIDQYIFSVSDNGIGIDSKNLKRIFSIFQRLHSREEYEGTGMGLAISEKIINDAGGQIWVESELNKGSTFYFTVPVK